LMSFFTAARAVLVVAMMRAPFVKLDG